MGLASASVKYEDWYWYSLFTLGTEFAVFLVFWDLMQLKWNWILSLILLREFTGQKTPHLHRVGTWIKWSFHFIPSWCVYVLSSSWSFPDLSCWHQSQDSLKVLVGSAFLQSWWSILFTHLFSLIGYKL